MGQVLRVSDDLDISTINLVHKLLLLAKATGVWK